MKKCELQTTSFVAPLDRSLVQMFDAAASYYRAHRGTGKDAVDVPTFFKSKRASVSGFRAYCSDSYKRSKTLEKHLKAALDQVGS